MLQTENFFAEIVDERLETTSASEWLSRVRDTKPAKRAKGTSKSSDMNLASQKGLADIEKLNGINNLVPVSFLEVGARLARSVGRVLANGGAGTGTLIGEDLLLTNNHVIEDLRSANGAAVEFLYERDTNGDFKKVDRRQIIDLVATDKRLDYSIVRVDQKPGNDYGFVDITKFVSPTPQHPSNGYPIIIQHPGGGEKMLAVTDNHIVGVNAPLFHYTTDTEPGTSGSLVFSHDWVPMGLHRAGRYTGFNQAGQRTAENEGVLLSAIVANLESKGVLTSRREIFSKMRALLQNPATLPDPTRPPDLAWFYNSNFQATLLSEAESNFEIAPLIAAAVGVAAGAGAAHWGHVTSKELAMGGEMTVALMLPSASGGEAASDLTTQFVIPTDTTPYGMFEFAYPTVRQPDLLPIMKTIVDQRRADRPDDFELAPLAAAFLAGVSAGALAYKAGK